VFFEPDSTWTEPLNRGSLFRLLKAKGVIIVVLNHDALPVILREVCHTNTLVSFAETIADHLQYADYALATSAGVERDLRKVARRFLGRSASALKGKLDMFVPDPHGAVVGGESVAVGEVCWMPLLLPERPGLYDIRFFATLDSGARLEARGVLTVIEDRPRP
jgi:hypothetical protein